MGKKKRQGKPLNQAVPVEVTCLLCGQVATRTMDTNSGQPPKFCSKQHAAKFQRDRRYATQHRALVAELVERKAAEDAPRCPTPAKEAFSTLAQAKAKASHRSRYGGGGPDRKVEAFQCECQAFHVGVPRTV